MKLQHSLRSVPPNLPPAIQSLPLLKKFVDGLDAPIASIVNFLLSSSVMPSEMKLAFVTPLLKKPNLCSDDLNNYRAVFLLSILSKLIECVVAKQLVKHLVAHNLYVPAQSAYRPNHLTETALLRVVNGHLLCLDLGDAAVLALLDQSSAFDTINHPILLNRLSSCFGITGFVLNWFHTYLSDVSQSVSISGVTSATALLLFNVSLGSVRGPLFFPLFSNIPSARRH